ncbi:uncharacterized protein LOC114296867 [Camellia sinensis]|uniref:uncharacterized protein LOC114296867 n=1 Tax=Camellia sinensis TaxID=4442 RepID=UPI0010365FCE|nr:uncharacterized protein LOC114296867 [Camellia sinensis]
MYHDLKEHFWWTGMKKDIASHISKCLHCQQISPTRGVIRFGKRGKLNPRYIGPFEILERIGPVAYRLALPPELSNVHNVFHVSMFHRYLRDPEHVVDYKNLEVQEDLSYEKQSVHILDYCDQVLRNKTVPLVKVSWRNHRVEEATWETESQIRAKYPHLFEKQAMPSLKTNFF